ncbi:MAG: hypothetical protein UU73_C0003G0276 [Candidatus Daviesbacteria bacterium GW2011_GWA1_41_61]|uniref:DUF4352 domain-containing protein n=1 Tax=Candidatus Daviesbacteria bacterium GW2011_GWA2_40_9 TaxID=1618424 RepID=A0A0G0WEH7_9BACT|nr:MAG: hypothetical protein UU26_C0004G0006 [Candidatus Daviesbacteria bacterium GW2011_GWC1_40_9]KKR82670.1 MAG: hypothetical protein UU29_C0010G0016 [Candidatus Daviesbacteria bacterium GW2011_GWA2_40_9]KKR93374.1 MAG: hypothetical protein UU44_C0002G0035 [Candidatus Daviesbacteria bacterium GW2011_GWB1_41_15]KKS15077.1 MAG: hypothetical protein UU73_C0003G0276 [Candidatus Daviesbacteria bacterium GW2011_GWA1_41_61]
MLTARIPSIRLSKKYLFIGLGILAAGSLIFLGTRPGLLKNSQDNFSLTAPIPNKSLQIAEPTAKTSLNKEFSFPINDSQGKQVGTLKYNIEGAEVRKEIVVKGQKATAVAGRIFLIFNLRLINEGQQKIQVNTRDFLRISANGGQEWLAPDIHNDPVEAQPISTKYTRLGFPVNEGQKNFQVQVGEINGEKTTFDLQF